MYSIRNCWRRPMCKMVMSMGPGAKESPGYGTENVGSTDPHNRIIAEAIGDHNVQRAVKVEIVNCGGVRIISYFDRTKHGIAASLSKYQVDSAICVVRNATRSSIPSHRQNSHLPAGHIYAVAWVGAFSALPGLPPSHWSAVDNTAIFGLLQQTLIATASNYVGLPARAGVGTSRVEPVCQEEITHEPDVRMNREKAASCEAHARAIRSNRHQKQLTLTHLRMNERIHALLER